jgi:glycosyltransferase involved in cell wall biosynthesis
VKLVALIEAPDHVCFRYRIQAFAAALARRDWQLEALPLAKSGFRRVAQLRSVTTADAVILQRKLLPPWQLCLLRNSARTLIYDFDDALFHRDSYHRKGTQSWQRWAYFWATIYAADAVTAGNAFLRDQAAAFVPGERVHYFPTCVEPERYPIAKHERQGGEIKLVWIGQRSTLPSLSLARAHLAAAAAKLPGLQLKVVSDAFPDLAGVTVLQKTWSSQCEAAELAEADIGVSWLPDDPWSRGKCGLKVLQFMAAGLPVIANPVGANCEMVVPGETGFLASTPDEWALAIQRLAGDPELRTRMGAAGRRRVEREYSVARWSEDFVQRLNSLAGADVKAARQRQLAGRGRSTVWEAAR